MIPNDPSGIIGAVATIAAVALVIFMVIRRRERSIAKLGYFPCEDIPARLAELVVAFTGYEPAGVREREKSAIPMYMIELDTGTDDGPVYCVAAKTDAPVGGRLVFLKAFGNRTLLELAEKAGGGLLDKEYAKRGLMPLEDFNGEYLSSHGIKAYADHAPDTESPIFKNLLLPVMEFDKDAAGAGCADGYVLAWCGSPKRAHRLCEDMAQAVHETQIG